MYDDLTPEEYIDLVLDIAYFRSELSSLPEFYRSFSAISLLIEVAIDLIIREPDKAEEVLYSDNIYFWLLLKEDIMERGI
jgi:hypothetical protein